MATYVFLDGPLAGQALDSRDVHARGEHIEVGVVDVCQTADDVTSFGYAVHAPARLGRPGGLRYVGPKPTPHPSQVSAA